MALTAATALTQIEMALRDTIATRYGWAVLVANAAALAALASASQAHNAQALVVGDGVLWRFNRFSTAAASATVVVPDDAPTAGRWIQVGERNSTGYLKAVELYEGQASAQEILGRFRVRPCVVVVWDGSDNKAQSLIPGALYDYRPEFLLWVLSTNLRPEHQAAIGSAISAEAAADPGTNKILGDLKYLLAGNKLGLAGVKWCELGRESRVFTSLADRVMVYQLRVTVLATVHHAEEAPDEVPFPLDDPGGFQVQRGLRQDDGTFQDFGPVDSVPQP